MVIYNILFVSDTHHRRSQVKTAKGSVMTCGPSKLNMSWIVVMVMTLSSLPSSSRAMTWFPERQETVHMINEGTEFLLAGQDRGVVS